MPKKLSPEELEAAERFADIAWYIERVGHLKAEIARLRRLNTEYRLAWNTAEDEINRLRAEALHEIEGLNAGIALLRQENERLRERYR
jgi:uncharacterized small protein (DUF1192 family)